METFKRNWRIILGLFGLLVIIIIILARVGVINSGIFGYKGPKTEAAAPQKVTFNDKVIEHESEITALQNTVDGLVRRLDALEKTCNNKTANSSSAQKSNSAKNQTVNQSSDADKHPKEEIYNIYPIPRDGQPSTANLDYLRENDKIIYCILTNGLGNHHFPQFALDRGVKFTAVKSNLTGDGKNWEVEPVNDIEGDVGVTMDGVFFVKDFWLETVLNANGETVTSVDIKTPYTKWQPKPMVQLGDYWIFETRRP